jgi:nucleoside-diphosphate-sugar epimerase
MRIFIAGATGTLGRPVVRLLLSNGHELIGLTRSAERARSLTAAGVRPVVANALDAPALRAAVIDAHPDVVVHLLTALPAAGPFRKSQLVPTNELRTKGTANLIEASIAAGAQRLVVESFATVYGQAPPDRLLVEDEPLLPVGSGPDGDTINTLRVMEEQLQRTRSAGQLTTVVLRIGYLYGSDVPGTQELARQARAGWLFVPRSFVGVGPFVHVDDAASAIVAAIERRDPSAVYNVAGDEPLELRTFLEQLAKAVGARPPRHIPRWVVSLAAPMLASFGTKSLLLSNERIKQELGWTPRYPTVQSGMIEVRDGLAARRWTAGRS